MKQILIRALFTFVFSLLSATSALAGFDEGMAAYERGKYQAALKEFLPLAEQGNAQAQLQLGKMHFGGQGVPKDIPEGINWTRKAAENGLVEAQLFLGMMYSFGMGVPEDLAKALKWFRMAAEQGSSEAQMLVSAMHASGQGVTQQDDVGQLIR